jgi:hypothetical protein
MPTAKLLFARASLLSDDSSTGPDGRAPVELKRLPIWIREHVAVFWQLIFEHGAPWPQDLLKAHVALIPKSNDGPRTPSNQRPITILSAHHRVFSSCMLTSLIKWHDRLSPPTLYGGKPGADALKTALEIGLTLEEAIALHERGLLLVSLDLSKFFGSIDCGPY